MAEAREQGRLILIAEDDEVNRKVILRQIGMLGHAAEVAKNGQEALRLWRRGRYALLLTDLHMPEMDGLQATRQMRQLPGLAQTPIVAMTANAMSTDRKACLDAGMNDHIGKPFNLPVLVALLRRITNRKAP